MQFFFICRLGKKCNKYRSATHRMSDHARRSTIFRLDLAVCSNIWLRGRCICL